MNISESIGKELDMLLISFGIGILLVFVYDILRILRRLIPHGTFWVSVEDFLFWTGSAVVVFVMLYPISGGYLRGFSIGGIVLGMLLYNLYVSRYLVQGIVWVVRFLKKQLKKIWKAVKIGLCKR